MIDRLSAFDIRTGNIERGRIFFKSIKIEKKNGTPTNWRLRRLYMKKKDVIALVIVIAVAIILGAVCGKLLLDNLI